MGDECTEKSNCEKKYQQNWLFRRDTQWCVVEVVLYAGLDGGWGDWLAATSCAKLLLSCTDFTHLSVFIYAWSDQGGWVVCKAEYFSSEDLYFSFSIHPSLLLSCVSPGLYSSGCFSSILWEITFQDSHFVVLLCRISYKTRCFFNATMQSPIL